MMRFSFWIIVSDFLDGAGVNLEQGGFEQFNEHPVPEVALDHDGVNFLLFGFDG